MMFNFASTQYTLLPIRSKVKPLGHLTSLPIITYNKSVYQIKTNCIENNFNIHNKLFILFLISITNIFYVISFLTERWVPSMPARSMRASSLQSVQNIHPSKGFNAIALGSWIRSRIKVFLIFPSKLANSMVSFPESVQ